MEYIHFLNLSIPGIADNVNEVLFWYRQHQNNLTNDRVNLLRTKSFVLEEVSQELGSDLYHSCYFHRRYRSYK